VDWEHVSLSTYFLPMRNLKGDIMKMKRIAIDVTQEEYDIITKVLPWGVRQTFFKYIIEDICKVMTSPVGKDVIAQMIARRISYTDLPNSMMKGAKGADDR
jgi:hypothetical protein